MNVNDRLEGLRATLYEPASDQTWTQIVAHLDAWPREEGLEIGLDYVDSHLKGWDDGLRSVPASWRKRVFNGEPAPRCKVARRLTVSAMGGGDSSARAVSRCHDLNNLTILEMAHNDITEHGAEALAESGALRGLEKLDLGGNPLKDKGVALLAVASDLSALRVLDLTSTRFGDEGLGTLLGTPLPSLRVLKFWGNTIGHKGAVALANTELIGQLDALDLGWNGIGDVGARALAQARVSGPFDLNVSNNKITNDGLRILTGSETLRAAGARLNTVLNGTTHASRRLL